MANEIVRSVVNRSLFKIEEDLAVLIQLADEADGPEGTPEQKAEVQRILDG